ncbi:MAG: TolC family protein [Proteobacteria bacterium]|nr:TolC family protein [Pseudomonadota bacterium]
MSHFKIRSILLIIFLLFPFYLQAYTLEELIKLGTKSYPLLQQQKLIVSSEKERYKASFDPYYPTLDFSLGYTNYLQSRLNPQLDDKNFYSGSFSLGYTLFNEKRAPAKEIKKYTFMIEENIYKGLEKDLVKYIKDLYFKILAEKKKLESRKETLHSAKRSLDLASAKKDVGIARLAEVYQANVRYENAKLNIIETENNLKKLLYELSSIIDKDITEKDIEGELNPTLIPFPEEDLANIALERREEIIREKLTFKSLEEERKIVKSEFYPTAQTFLTYRRSDGSFVPPPSKEETRLDIVLNWNIFSGPGKFHNLKASDYNLSAQKKRIEDVIRNIKLDVKKILADFHTATEQIKASEALLKSAKQNFDQAYEEYRIGKGDILSLIQSEIDLANAKENYITTILNQNLAKNILERTLGINSFEELK